MAALAAWRAIIHAVEGCRVRMAYVVKSSVYHNFN